MESEWQKSPQKKGDREKKKREIYEGPLSGPVRGEFGLVLGGVSEVTGT
jgi:hypothetical protein